MERIVHFGPGEQLFGVMTEPTGLDAAVPAVLWLNAGTLSHVGPFGWYTAFARRLADRLGLVNLRFDLNGIGESPLRDDGHGVLERACADVAAAMDLLIARRGCQRFVLVGLCSGAVLAHQAAIQDARVVGAVMLDGYGYRTAGYHVRHIWRRLFKLRSWRSAAARLARSLLHVPPPPAPVPLGESFFFEYPSRQHARADLQRLRQRDVRLLFRYSSSVADHYFNARRQFEEMFGSFDDGIEVDFAASADHLYTQSHAREALYERIEGWLQTHWLHPSVRAIQSP